MVAEPLLIPVDAFISQEYADAEADRLWAKVWQQAGRVEEIPEVGNFITYEICNDSILIVRTAPDTIKAYHNVCTHRGRRLVSTPQGAHSAGGKKMKFVCGYHAWNFDLDGKATYILDKDDWKTRQRWLRHQNAQSRRRVCIAPPNPWQERKVSNLHRNLADYMNAGAPRLLKR